MLQTQMRQEILEIPTVVARIVESGAADIQLAAAALRTHDPQFLFSVARGSSNIGLSKNSNLVDILKSQNRAFR